MDSINREFWGKKLEFATKINNNLMNMESKYDGG